MVFRAGFVYSTLVFFFFFAGEAEANPLVSSNMFINCGQAGHFRAGNETPNSG